MVRMLEVQIMMESMNKNKRSLYQIGGEMKEIINREGEVLVLEEEQENLSNKTYI